VGSVYNAVDVLPTGGAGGNSTTRSGGAGGAAGHVGGGLAKITQASPWAGRHPNGFLKGGGGGGGGALTNTVATTSVSGGGGSGGGGVCLIANQIANGGRISANGGAGSYQITYNGLIKAEITEAQADFGNSNTQNFCIINDAGISDLGLANLVSIYPNPATTTVTITANGLQITAIDLMSITGQLIESTNGEGKTTSLNLASLSSGVYFIRVTTEQGIALKQLVIE
jgi:hypothetical protein